MLDWAWVNNPTQWPKPLDPKIVSPNPKTNPTQNSLNGLKS